MIEKIHSQNTTLVDQVADRLIDYFVDNNLGPGCAIPSELSLAENLGVARSVVREAISRFKMMGMIDSRPRRGMNLIEPKIFGGFKAIKNPNWLDDETLFDLLELRIALEIGCTSLIFRHLTEKDIDELDEIVKAGKAFGNNKYAPISEYNFHIKLYEITKNKSIIEFQALIHPVFTFIKNRYENYFQPIAERLKENGEQVSHEELLECIKRREEDAFYKAIRQHFKIYTDFLNMLPERK